MSFALQPTNIIPVKVEGTWDATVAATCVIAALEASFPGVFVFPMTEGITLTLVRYLSTGSEKAVLAIAATTGTGTLSTAFDHSPADGEVIYITSLV